MWAATICPARMAEQMIGKGVGDTGDIYLQPEDAFGDYEPDLLLVEDRKLFPPNWKRA